MGVASTCTHRVHVQGTHMGRIGICILVDMGEDGGGNCGSWNPPWWVCVTSHPDPSVSATLFSCASPPQFPSWRNLGSIWDFRIAGLLLFRSLSPCEPQNELGWCRIVGTLNTTAVKPSTHFTWSGEHPFNVRSNFTEMFGIASSIQDSLTMMFAFLQKDRSGSKPLGSSSFGSCTFIDKTRVWVWRCWTVCRCEALARPLAISLQLQTKPQALRLGRLLGFNYSPDCCWELRQLSSHANKKEWWLLCKQCSLQWF